MKRRDFLRGSAAAAAALSVTGFWPRQALAAARPPASQKLEPVPYSAVRITDGFWSPRIDLNQKVSLRASFQECEKAGNLDNFRIAAGWIKGEHKGSQAYDSDVYKIIEGAGYSLKLHPDPELEAYVDRLIDAIAAAQQKDGYLNTYFTLKAPDQKWKKLQTEHELYCAGHFFEAAVAYSQATGKRKILDTARRLADHLDSVFGPGKRYDVPGHQEVELALVKLFRLTGEQRYFDLAKFFLDERGYAHGQTHLRPTPEEIARQNQVDPKNRRSIWLTRKYRQDHLPVVEQDEAVGHAVRAGYMYAAMADVAAITGDAGYLQAGDRLWENVVGKKIYITGGVGTAQFQDEGFGTPYNLPNEKAYCETCAAVANIFWNYRLNLLHGEAKYIDVLELGLYNGFLAGVSLSGDRFFYENPLASRGKVLRDSWSDPACCPSNVVRLIPQIGNFIYARDGQGFYVNLYLGSTTVLPWKDGSVRLTQTTRYPWEGKVKVLVEPDKTEEFVLNLRLPGWTGEGPIAGDLYRFDNDAPGQTPGPTLAVNGKSVAPRQFKQGYLQIRRRWQKGDVVELDLPMPVRRVRAHPNVEADRGCVALMRGPILYCFEAADNPFDVLKLGLPKGASLKVEHQDALLGGVTVFHGQGLLEGKTAVNMTAIPYYVWSNRQPGAMTVWVPEVQ
jgi:hypothetical protein